MQSQSHSPQAQSPSQSPPQVQPPMSPSNSQSNLLRGISPDVGKFQKVNMKETMISSGGMKQSKSENRLSQMIDQQEQMPTSPRTISFISILQSDNDNQNQAQNQNQTQNQNQNQNQNQKETSENRRRSVGLGNQKAISRSQSTTFSDRSSGSNLTRYHEKISQVWTPEKKVETGTISTELVSIFGPYKTFRKGATIENATTSTITPTNANTTVLPEAVKIQKRSSRNFESSN